MKLKVLGQHRGAMRSGRLDQLRVEGQGGFGRDRRDCGEEPVHVPAARRDLENRVGLSQGVQPLALGGGIRPGPVHIGEEKLLGVRRLIGIGADSRGRKHFPLFQTLDVENQSESSRLRSAWSDHPRAPRNAEVALHEESPMSRGSPIRKETVTRAQSA